MSNNFSFANLANLPMLESLYEKWKANPESVEHSWRFFFEGMQFAAKTTPETGGRGSPDLRVFELIYSYRTYGHLLAKINPIATHDPEPVPELTLENHGLKQDDLNTNFPTGGFLREANAPL